MQVKHKKYRTVVFYKNDFDLFFARQKQKVKDKIIWTLQLIETLPKVPETYLKHLSGTDGLYEIRVQQGTDIFRIFCFFEKEKIIVVLHGFQKKSQKTPSNEIQKALMNKKEYENEKE